MNKKHDLIFIFIFLIIVFSIFLWFPYKHFLIITGKNELQMSDNWVFYEKKNKTLFGMINDVINEKKINIENRVTNYFPFYQLLNQEYHQLNLELNKLIYKDIIPVGTNSNNEFIFYIWHFL